MGAAGLSAADPSAAVATVTAAAPRLLAFGKSVAPPPCRTAWPDDQVPKTFPGEKGIMRPNMAPFLLVFFLSWILFDPMSRSAIATAGRLRKVQKGHHVCCFWLFQGICRERGGSVGCYDEGSSS
jgi:hypothetical protein